MRSFIIPSIIARNQKELNQRLKKVKFSKIIHLDVMDGKFVRNKSLMFDFALPFRFKIVNYEAHLMMKNPTNWIKKHYKKVDLIIVHYESRDIKKIIELIKKCKRKIGLAVNPGIPLTKLKNIPIREIDTLLIMTVYPGRYGSSFLPLMIKKIKQARKRYPKLNIEVDGSINEKTIRKVFHTGANKFVVGSYLQNADDVKERINELKRIISYSERHKPFPK
ncbi:ribulose-phosphate 3-epimerase [Candidatus Pacearchaeota archaeon]|nr:ribulose-phosphate 3-epimerase [Candidatus Pacearchaeota archaeon]